MGIGGRAGDEWAAMREDPVRKRLRGRPELDTILTLYPRTQGPPACLWSLGARMPQDARSTTLRPVGNRQPGP